MITHFFESYILINNLISIEQLVEVMELQKATRIKLGLLAISAGYMTALQVDEVNNIQKKVDKLFGDIAVDRGYLTANQVKELLGSQIEPYLLLGQALIDRGYITNALFEKAVTSYKRENEISDAEFNGSQNAKIKLVIADFYNFINIKNAEIYVEYVAFLLKDIIRFIGDDFTPLKPRIINGYTYDCLVYQNIEGQMNVYSAIEAQTDVFVEFASRYSKEPLVENDEYAHSAVGEFLNINNGLFCSNIVNTKQAIVELTPQILENKGVVNGLETAFLIPVYFTFGVVNFILSVKELPAY